MKKISSTGRGPGISKATTVVRTGSHCPVNGFWGPLEASAEAIFVFEGSMMPALDGGSVIWTLVDAGDKSRASGSPRTGTRTEK